MTSTEILDYISAYRDDDVNHPDFIPVDKGLWSLGTVSVDVLVRECFTLSRAKVWLCNEIARLTNDGYSFKAQTYLVMLATGINEPAIITFNSHGGMRVGDGWHRIAISIIRNEPLKAIIGVRK